MAEINSEKGAITNLDQAWEGHTHYEVEQFLKDQIEILNGQTVRSKIQIAVNGNAIKSFLESSTSEKVNYKVTYTKDTIEQTACKLKVTVGTKVVYNGDSVAGSNADTVNLATALASFSDNTIYVTIKAYDIDENGAETVSSTARVTFNRKTATLVCSTELGEINPVSINYTATFNSGDTATLYTKYYDAGGTELQKTVSKTLTTRGSVTTSVPPYLSAGAHVVKSYLVVNESTDPVIGESVSTTIVSTVGASNGDVFIVVGEVKNAIVNDYTDIQFMIYVVGSSSNTIPVAMRELSGTSYITKAIRKVANGAKQTWHYLVKSDSTTLLIGVPDTNADGTLKYSAGGNLIFTLTPVTFTINAIPGAITWVTPDGSVAYFSMQNKTNNDYDIGILKSGRYSAVFDDVQFNSAGSGYKDITIGTNMSTALHLVGTSRVTLGTLYPFYDTYTPSGEDTVSGGGILAKGRTLKMSFMVSNVSNPDERVIDCWDSTGKMGFYVTGNAIYINLGKELISLPEEGQAKAGHNARRFSSDTKIDLTIVVQPYYSNGSETSHELRYYINGEIAGFAVLKDSEIDLTSLSQSRAVPITFGGNGAILDLFDVRYYEKALSSFEVLQMRTMDLDNSSDIADIFNKNNYYETDDSGNPIITLEQAIEYGKYLASHGQTGYAVWACTNLCNGSAYIGNTKSHSTKAEYFYLFKFKQDTSGNGIIDPDTTICIESMGINTNKAESYLRCRRQGTSTASSTKGNIRVDVTNTCRIHRYDVETGKFFGWTGTSDPTKCYTVGKGSKIWQIPDANAIPCSLLTCKKNPNESTQARNLPTAKWYEACCRYLATINTGSASSPVYPYEDCLTKPQRRELESIIANRPTITTRSEQVNAIKTRQCVDGIPSLGFEIDYAGTEAALVDPLSLTSTFGGQFDMITDKSNMNVFGFGGYNTQDSDGNITWQNHITDNDYSIEWRRNDSPVCNFLQADLSLLNGESKLDDGTDNSLVGDLEYRYPTINDSSTVIAETNTKGKTKTRGMGKQEGIQRLFDLVRTCAIDKDDVGGIGTYYSRGEKLNYTKAGYIPIGEKFLGEANANNGEGFTWKYDNSANRLEKFKAELQYYVATNQILFNGLAILAALMCDQDTKNQFFTHYTGEERDGYDVLRLLGYDFDSSWGIDNDNFFRFLYTVLYEDGLYDGKAICPATGFLKGPQFWKLIFAAYKTEIATLAGLLYDGFLKKSAILSYMQTNQVDIYNAMQFNANSEYSYTSSAADYLKTHGSAKEHTAWFVEGRMHFLSGRLGTGSGNTPGGDFAQGVANFNLSIFNSSFIEEYPNNAANRGKNKWELLVQGYERTTVQLRYGAGLHFSPVNVNVTTIYDSDNLPTNVVYETASVKASDEIGSSAGDNRLAIYGGKHLKSVKGLANWYIASVMDWGDLNNVEELELGSTANLGTEESPEYYINPNLTALSISKTFGSCKKLNLAGCPNIKGMLSLIAFPVLEEFEGIRMDGVTSVTLPISNSLKKVSYPKNLTSLVIDNKPNLTDISMEGNSSITSISVTNSSAYAAQQAINILSNLI